MQRKALEWLLIGLWLVCLCWLCSVTPGKILAVTVLLYGYGKGTTNLDFLLLEITLVLLP
jgi:hypothetical protein